MYHTPAPPNRVQAGFQYPPLTGSLPAFLSSYQTLWSPESACASLSSVFLFQLLTHTHALTAPRLALPCSPSLVCVPCVYLFQSLPCLSPSPVSDLLQLSFRVSVYSSF